MHRHTRMNRPERLERRRREAAERQARYDALTLEQKLTQASRYPNSREFFRLSARKTKAA